MSKILYVYVLERMVGWLSDEGRVFTYLPNTPPECLVSLTMPVRAESYTWPRGLLPFFQQNLPEGYQKDRIRQRLGPHADMSDWGLLALTGKNVIGRVRVIPHDMPRSSTVSNIDMARILASPDSHSRLFHYLNEGVLEGISGVMPKALNADAKATIWTDDFILKTGTLNTPGQAINEFLCLQVARAAGLCVPQTELSEDGQVLAIARFDRLHGKRVALEDFCSLAGLDPVHKYKASLEAVATAHNEYVVAANRQASAMQLYRLMLLNYALHNGDAHLKNFALLYTHYDDAAIAPVYDIVTTSAYPQLDDMPALTLGGKKAWWMGKQLRILGATRLSLGQKELDDAQDCIHTAIDQTLPLVKTMMERYPFFRETGKRMIVEWTAGKLDIMANAKKRNRLVEPNDPNDPNNIALQGMHLSDVKTSPKKKTSHAPDSSLRIKK